MWPVLIAAARTYAPMIVFPFAVAAGFIGYNIESLVSDRNTPWRGSTIERREERKIAEGDREFVVPKNIFEKNKREEQ
jgi:hypothetical protein